MREDQISQVRDLLIEDAMKKQNPVRWFFRCYLRKTFVGKIKESPFASKMSWFLILITFVLGLVLSRVNW